MSMKIKETREYELSWYSVGTSCVTNEFVNIFICTLRGHFYD